MAVALFADRAAAGRELAAGLERWRGADAVVWGIPRGGVVVAAQVARLLDLPLSAIAVRKVGAAGRPELAVGAIAEGVRVVDAAAMRATGTTAEDFSATETGQRVELARRRDAFTVPAPAAGRTAIVVDDGVATGSTALAACRSLRQAGAARIVLAVPVAPAQWHPDAESVDEYACPHRIARFWAVGAFYDDFRQTDDDEVIGLLRDASPH